LTKEDAVAVPNTEHCWLHWLLSRSWEEPDASLRLWQQLDFFVLQQAMPG
jgi:NADH:ubiquinone oxidoreductase subunit